MANKAVYLPFIILGLVSILACGRLTQVAKDVSNAGNDEPKTLDPRSKSFTLAGKEWSSFDLSEIDLKVELPGKPGDKTPQLPPNLKTLFSAMRILSYDEKDFGSSFTELVPTGKKSFEIRYLADTSMAAIKRQAPDLTYTLDIKSETNAKYNGAFTKNGKSFDLRGCCVYEKANPARIWAVITVYPKDNTDARAAGQRIIDSVVFEGSSEECN